MNLTNLVIFGLATWRISSLFVVESGPFRVFHKIRELAGIVHDDEGTPYQYPDSFFGELLSCVWCTSIWVGAGWTLFWLLSPDVALKCAIPFAFSAAAILIDKFLKG